MKKPTSITTDNSTLVLIALALWLREEPGRIVRVMVRDGQFVVMRPPYGSRRLPLAFRKLVTPKSGPSLTD